MPFYKMSPKKFQKNEEIVAAEEAKY